MKMNKQIKKFLKVVKINFYLICDLKSIFMNKKN
jgi:hypothetical protein